MTPPDPARPVWWWLSFADPTLPVGQQFLGVAIVPAPSFLAAVTVAHQLGCNPGGEVMGFPCRVENVSLENRCRLLNETELRTIFPDIRRIDPPRALDDPN